MPKPIASLVVIAFNMERELPRTLVSLSPAYQRRVEELPYEVIVVDNGSVPPASVPDEPWLRLIRVDPATPSPARAVNLGIAASQADLIGVFIDGARIASPGIVRGAVEGSQMHPRAIVATVGFHLGPDSQARSIRSGYSREVEDELLAESGWEDDGYRLFGIASFAESSRHGWFGPLAESNALFMQRGMWEDLGGYEERFASPGGGLVNLDTYSRAVALPNSQLVIVLGEGTIHQLHGGVATNAETSPWPEFHAEYVSIRGHDFQVPDVEPLYLPPANPSVLDAVETPAR